VSDEKGFTDAGTGVGQGGQAIDEETGAVIFAEDDDAVAYGVVDEIARRAWLTGGRVLAVRREDVPGGGPVAAILRYAV
jgi:hypothetical protein